MANIEESPRKLILKAGSTTLTLDKDFGKATLQQKLLLWKKKACRVRALRYRRHRGEVGRGRPFRRVNPSQRLAQAYW